MVVEGVRGHRGHSARGVWGRGVWGRGCGAGGMRGMQGGGRNIARLDQSCHGT